MPPLAECRSSAGRFAVGTLRTDVTMPWRIRNWPKHFENNRTRELKHMAWVPIPNELDNPGYVELVEHELGECHFAVWIIMLEIASKCHPRGELWVRSPATIPQQGAGIPQQGAGIPHTHRTLSRLSRMREETFKSAIPRLLQIGWLEEFTTIPHEGAGLSQEGAAIPHLVRARARTGGMELNGTELNGNRSAARAAVAADAWEQSNENGGKRESGAIPPTNAECPPKIGKIDPTRVSGPANGIVDDSRRAKRERNPATGDHAEVMRHFCESWERRYRAKYSPCGAKDGAAVKRIIQANGGDVGLSSQMIDRFIACDDPFLEKQHHPLAWLGSNPNRFKAPERREVRTVQVFGEE